MKNLKCLMTDIPKIIKAFEGLVDVLHTSIQGKSLIVLTLQTGIDACEFEHFSCTVEGE